jgi:hypothetical protein
MLHPLNRPVLEVRNIALQNEGDAHENYPSCTGGGLMPAVSGSAGIAG